MKEKLLEAWDNYYNSLDKNWKYAYKDIRKVLEDNLDEAIKEAEHYEEKHFFKVEYIANYLGEIISDYYFENNYNLANILAYYFFNSGDLEPIKEHMEVEVWKQLYDYGEVHLYDKIPVKFTYEEEELMEEIFYKIGYFSNSFFLEYFITNNVDNLIGSTLTLADGFYFLLSRAFRRV